MKAPADAKYRDPRTRATWSGRGRTPALPMATRRSVSRHHLG
ncbi:H-NS family nucleoid-associated regulatory protein [Burkholderia cepacia]